MINYIGKTAVCAIKAPVLIGYGIVHDSALTTVGVAATVLSILTLGKSPFIDHYADWTCYSTNITRNFYKILVIVNPYLEELKDPSLGILTKKFAGPFYVKAFDEAASGNYFLSKHVVSRGALVLGALAAIVTRTADLVIGIIALVIAAVPFFGRAQNVNNFAYKQLGALGLINDICSSFRGIVNPQALFKDFLKKRKANSTAL